MTGLGRDSHSIHADQGVIHGRHQKGGSMRLRDMSYMALLNAATGTVCTGGRTRSITPGRTAPRGSPRPSGSTDRTGWSVAMGQA